MKNKTSVRVKKEIDTVLNEIRCLARIKNDFVVRYNHSWIEVVLKKNTENVKSQSSNFKKVELEKEHEEIESECEDDEWSKLEKDESSFVLTFQDDDSNVMFSRAAKNENNSHDSLFDSISSHNQLGKSKKYTLKTKNGKFGKK